MQPQEMQLVELMRAAIDPSVIPVLENPDFPAISALAQNHAVLPLLYPAVKRMQPAPEPSILSELKKISFSCAARESVQAKELQQIFSSFEEKQIRTLPLKGCVIKYLYPNPELRYMSDIDLLIEADNASAVRQIMESLGHRYEKVDAGETDVYVSPLGMHYEIHLTLASEGYNEASQLFAGSLLDLSRPKEGYQFIQELPPEEHFIYILCHFVKHFIYGGVGIRQLMDVYICHKRWTLNKETLDRYLSTLELGEFHAMLLRLCAHWFEGAEGDDTLNEFGTYLLTSGVFGTDERRVTDLMLQEGTGLRYYISRLFPPYRTMKQYFPLLRKLPFLLPFFWVWRAIRALLFRRGKLQTELNVLGQTEDSALKQRSAFYERCGLNVYTKNK